MLIGPGQDGDYGERRGRANRLRLYREKRCQNCGRTFDEHLDHYPGERVCPTAVYKSPVPPLKCDACHGDEHESEWECEVYKREMHKTVAKVMREQKAKKRKGQRP
jgi:hypothetical protein